MFKLFYRLKFLYKTPEQLAKENEFKETIKSLKKFTKRHKGSITIHDYYDQYRL